MALRVFIFVLLIISIMSILVPIDNNKIESLQKDIALVTFNNSTMYTLDDIHVTRVVSSTKTVRFKSRDEMYDATFLNRVKSNESGIFDIFNADFIEKKGADLKFLDNVKYNRNGFISLKTDVLYYNLDTKIGYNEAPFVAEYNNNSLIGNNIYIDIDKTYFKSQNAHFEIGLEKKEQ